MSQLRSLVVVSIALAIVFAFTAVAGTAVPRPPGIPNVSPALPRSIGSPATDIPFDAWGAISRGQSGGSEVMTFTGSGLRFRGLRSIDGGASYSATDLGPTGIFGRLVFEGSSGYLAGISLDPNGDVGVFLHETHDFGQSFSTQFVVQHGDLVHGIDFVNVSGNAGGSVVAIILRERPGGDLFGMVRVTGVWTPVQRLTQGADGSGIQGSVNVTVNVDPSGEACMAWIEDIGTGNQVLFQCYNGAWGAVQNIETQLSGAGLTRTNSQSPLIVTTGGGKLLTLWEANAGGIPEVVTLLDTGAGFSVVDQDLLLAGTPPVFPFLWVNPDDATHIVKTYTLSTGSISSELSRTGGTTWQAPNTLAASAVGLPGVAFKGTNFAIAYTDNAAATDPFGNYTDVFLYVTTTGGVSFTNQNVSGVPLGTTVNQMNGVINTNGSYQVHFERNQFDGNGFTEFQGTEPFASIAAMPGARTPGSRPRYGNNVTDVTVCNNVVLTASSETNPTSDLNDIWATRYSATDGTRLSRTPISDGSEDSFWPICDCAGNFGVCSWIQFDTVAAAYFVHTSHTADGGLNWSPPVDHAGLGVQLLSQRDTVVRPGLAAVVLSIGFDIFLLESTNGTTWTTTSMGRGSGFEESPSIRNCGGNFRVLTWAAANVAVNQFAIWARFDTTGAGFGAPVEISDEISTQGASVFAFDCDDDGVDQRATFLYEQFGSIPRDLFLNTWLNGTLSARLQIDSPTTEDGTIGGVEILASGDACISYLTDTVVNGVNPFARDFTGEVHAGLCSGGVCSDTHLTAGLGDFFRESVQSYPGHIVWEDGAAGRETLVAVETTDCNTFSNPLDLFNPPELAQGNVFVTTVPARDPRRSCVVDGDRLYCSLTSDRYGAFFGNDLVAHLPDNHDWDGLPNTGGDPDCNDQDPEALRVPIEVEIVSMQLVGASPITVTTAADPLPAAGPGTELHFAAGDLFDLRADNGFLQVGCADADVNQTGALSFDWSPGSGSEYLVPYGQNSCATVTGHGGLGPICP